MEKVSNYIYTWVKKAFYLAVSGVTLLIALTIFYQEDLRGVESNVVYSIQLALENNGLLFASPESPPFNITQYSPLYYVICDIAISVLPIDYDNYFAIRVITRIISLVLLILSLWVIYDLLHRFIGTSKSTSLIIALVYLVFSFPWFNISRPDVLVLLFFTLSIRSILICLENDKNFNMAILLGFFMALGVLSKLSMAFYIMAFGLYMIIAKKYRLAFLSALSFSVSFLLMCFTIQILGYDLSFLYDNIVKGVDNGTSFFAAWGKSYENYFSCFGLLTLVFILFSMVYLKNWKKVKINSNLFFLLTISYTVAIFSFLSALKVGSAINYFNELILCMLLFITYFIENYYKLQKKVYLISLMLLGVSITINHTFLYAGRLFINSFYYTQSNKKDSDVLEILDFLKSNLGSGYFYSQSREIALSHPQRCILFPADIHNIAYNRKVFNYSIVEEWAKPNLKFIIVSPDRTELYGIDIKKCYSLKIIYRNYYLYEIKTN
jgi:hypothetical protein